MTSILPQAYSVAQPTTSVFPPPIRARRAPASNDKGYPIGQQWINEVADTIYELSSVSNNSANWQLLGGASADVNTLSGDTGTASPAAGNIQIGGTVNQIVTSAAGSTVTVALTDDVIVNNSIIADNFLTSNAVSGVEIIDNVIASIGAGANVDLFVGAKGTGLVVDNRTVIGNSLTHIIQNDDNTNAASDATLHLVSGGASGGSPYLYYAIDALNDWTSGIDNADADCYAVARGLGFATKALRIDFTNLDVAVSAGDLIISTAAKGVQLNGTGPKLVAGAGDPNGAVTAPQGSLYLRTDGSSTTTRAYINTDSVTAWTSVTTAT